MELKLGNRFTSSFGRAILLTWRTWFRYLTFLSTIKTTSFALLPKSCYVATMFMDGVDLDFRISLHVLHQNVRLIPTKNIYFADLGLRVFGITHSSVQTPCHFFALIHSPRFFIIAHKFIVVESCRVFAPM